MTAPAVSVVIPTHDRRDAVARALRALSVQTYPSAALDIVVVADGCSDDTAALGAVPWTVPVRIIEQPAAGPAAARNRGAAAARGDMLIFLDDDIEVVPGFVAAHVEAHAVTDRVAIGYLPPQLQGRRDFFAVMLRAWWEDMFERMRDPGHRFAYTDLLSGNFSLSRVLFEKVGRFDETLPCHEDYELGHRLVAAGAGFVFAPAAAGWHHERTDLARALQRKRDEGHADVALARKYPTLARTFPLAHPDTRLTRRGRIVRRVAFAHPAAGDFAERVFRRLLRGLEALRLRTRWRQLLKDLLSYWYWRGVAESLDGLPLGELLPSSAAPAVHRLDLRQGLEAAAAEIDGVRPAALALHWGALVVGTVPFRPGAEPLRGRHLRSLLRDRFATRFAETLAMAEHEHQSPVVIPTPSGRVARAHDARGAT